MGNSKTVYRFEIPKFNNIEFVTIGISSMKNIAKQLNNDYKGLDFNVKGLPTTTIGDFMKQSYPKGEIPRIFIPSNDIKIDDFTNKINTILNKKK
jgi:hypothetical protein